MNAPESEKSQRIEALEAELARVRGLLRTGVEVVAAFADVGTGDEAIARALETFAQLARVDLCSVGLFSRDGMYLETQHTWPNLENLPPPAMPVAQFGWTDRQIRALHHVHVPRTADLPLEAVGERLASATVGVRSILMVPLVQRGEAIGYLSCGMLRAERTFADDEIAVARSVADLLAGALVRARTERDWARLFDCLRGIGADTGANLERLTAFAKDVVGASFARYVRRGDTDPTSVLCNQILLGPADRLVTQNDLSAFVSDPVFVEHRLAAFVGRVVVAEGAPVGALCLGFSRAFAPTLEQARLVEAIADALAVEEVRAAAQRALQHTLAELEAVLESTADGVLVADRHGAPLRQNQRFLEIWAVPREITGDLEALGRHRLTQLVDPFGYLTKIADLCDDATTTDFTTLELVDGRTLARTSVPFLVDGQHRGRVWTVRDVTATVRREEELRHTLALLEATFEATADGLLVADLRGHSLRENRRLQEMWHTDPAPLDDPQELARLRLGLVEDPLSFVRNLIDLYADTSSELFASVRFRDGRVFERYSLPLRVAGQAVGRVMSYRDVTDRMRREEALGQTMALLEATFEATADGVLAVDVHGRPLRFNRHLLALWKVPEGVDPTDIHALRASARTVIADPVPIIAEWERLCADPERRESSTVHLADGGVLERHSVPLWVDGRHAGRVFTYREVTERVRAEFNRALLATAVDQAGEAVVVTALDGTIEYVNPAFERMSLHRAEDVRGKTPRILKSDRHEPDTFSSLWSTILAGKVWSGRLVNRRADGTSFEVDEVIAPVRAPDGTITNFVALLHDVTREHQLEEEVRQAQKMEAVGRLAGGIAHDFNNLLTAVIGYAELIASALDRGERVNEEIDEILRAAKRAASLTQQLLAFSRRQVLKPRVLDLNEVVNGLTRMLRRLIPENVTIQAVLDPTIEPIKADPGQMEQVMLNLAINARDAMPSSGQLTLVTEAVTLARTTLVGHDAMPPGEYVRLSVRDTGHGMDAGTLAHVFEPFFTTKGVGKGTGLGLATVYGIVRQSGGGIEVRSAVGQGTTFEMLFPTCPRATDAAKRPSPVPTSEPARTLLLVEDESSVRAVVSKVLRASGYRVLEAQDGVEALALVREHLSTLDALITDVVMPRMSGPELVSRVCAERPSLPVLFMSGHVDAAVSGHELPTGAAFLPKPFEPDTLRRAMHNLLSPRIDTPRPRRG